MIHKMSFEQICIEFSIPITVYNDPVLDFRVFIKINFYGHINDLKMSSY